MTFQFDKLRLSRRQSSVDNPECAFGSWRQKFFWTDGLILLNWTGGLLYGMREINLEARRDFFRGSLPKKIEKLNPKLFARWPVKQVIEYCEVTMSKDRALTRLILKARGERESRVPNDSRMKMGAIPMDARQYAIRQATTHKKVNLMAMPGLIHEAAKENDVRFFIRLGRALQSSKKIPEIDWERVDPTARFLVDNWIEPQYYASNLPALCFFSDQALADFSSAAFGRRDGNPSCAAIRQWRKRLGLKQVRSPKVKETILIKDEILFVGDPPDVR